MTITTPDAVVLARARRALEWSPDIDNADLDLAVDNGRLVVSGLVDSHAERLAVLACAAEAAHDTELIDRMTVRPAGAHGELGDAALTAAARDALWAAGPHPGVDVLVVQHVAILEGAVRTARQRQACRHIVAKLPGIHFVDNRVTVDEH